MKYRADIDGLRALAVLPVLLAHAHFGFFSGGFVGVDIFFVISGFLITSILAKEGRDGSFSLLSFYERRARRIFPALFTMIAFTCVATFIYFPAREFEAFGRSVIATTFFVSNMLFWKETGYFDVLAENRPLLHTWSLSVEEQFYVLFPISVWITYRHLRGRFELWIPAAALGSLALSIWWVESHPTAAFYLSLPLAHGSCWLARPWRSKWFRPCRVAACAKVPRFSASSASRSASRCLPTPRTFPASMQSSPVQARDSSFMRGRVAVPWSGVFSAGDPLSSLD